MKDYITLLVGGADGMIYALAAFVVMNYITGILVSVDEKKWLKGKLGLKSIFEKIGIFVIICIANILDTVITGDDSTIRTLVILFYLSKEGIAILDNLEHLGVSLPPIIVKMIKQLNKEENRDNSAIDNAETQSPTMGRTPEENNLSGDTGVSGNIGADEIQSEDSLLKKANFLKTKDVDYDIIVISGDKVHITVYQMKVHSDDCTGRIFHTEGFYCASHDGRIEEYYHYYMMVCSAQGSGFVWTDDSYVYPDK